MTTASYTLAGPIGTRASLGLVVLQTDETIEHDFRRLIPEPDAALYVSRIPSAADVTPETLRQMERDLPQAAGLLPPSVDYASVGYACTSGTTMIGPARIASLIRKAVPGARVATPLTAAIEAMAALGARRIGLLTPYIESVTAPLRAAFEDAGLTVPETVSFGEASEARVARIDAASIHDAALTLGQTPDLDAVFLSCTNLRTMEVIDGIEAAIGRPAVSSNLALAWQMRGQAGLGPAPKKAPGILFRTPYAALEM